MINCEQSTSAWDQILYQVIHNSEAKQINRISMGVDGRVFDCAVPVHRNNNMLLNTLQEKNNQWISIAAINNK